MGFPRLILFRSCSILTPYPAFAWVVGLPSHTFFVLTLHPVVARGGPGRWVGLLYLTLFILNVYPVVARGGPGRRVGVPHLDNDERWDNEHHRMQRSRQVCREFLWRHVCSRRTRSILQPLRCAEL